MAFATILDELKKEYEAFLAGSARTRIIQVACLSLYVRKNVRYFRSIANAAVHVIDIASIDIADDALKGKGLGTQVIAYLHSANPVQATYIENVLNPRLREHLLRSGWQATAANEFYSSYIKLTGKTQMHQDPLLRSMASH